MLTGGHSHLDRAQLLDGLLVFGNWYITVTSLLHHCYITVPQLLDGLLVFGNCAQLTPAELLRVATSEAAAACCLEGETGCVAEGLAADLLVVPGNPLEDVEAALRHMLLVVCAGRLVEPCTPAQSPKPRRSLVPSWTHAAVETPQPCPCTLRMQAAAKADSRV